VLGSESNGSAAEGGIRVCVVRAGADTVGMHIPRSAAGHALRSMLTSGRRTHAPLLRGRRA